MKSIFKRELKSYFTGPLGYIVVLVYLIYYALMFVYSFKNGTPNVSSILSSSYMVTLFIAPILTMRLFSEERKQKTDQILLTSPVSIIGIVLGKLLAALTVFTIPAASTFIYQFIFANYASVNWGAFFCALLGTLLFGATIISIGILISSLTENQLVAAVGSLTISILLITIDTFVSIINVSIISTISEWVSFIGRYQSFIEGIFDWSNFMFFLTFTALFTFITIRIQESRRWA